MWQIKSETTFLYFVWADKRGGSVAKYIFKNYNHWYYKIENAYTG